ncbi:DUF3320 domain-containing protein [Methanobrevibacter sp. TMH8]|uniref:DUF3320 domain-containing protein n=1 Tax=Methanobrevibacter sp. TMH8 TaxID=2848611 RepID=UPI001CCD0D24|nr:DUF4011 domain-containing protein [Methanobrevibacter sp. TMH8]MBZ9570895.1 DUF3320 domain-containing protein [Methanobrevibacter sp. TMH8]
MGKTSSNDIKKEFENLRNNLLDLTLRNQLLNFKPRSKTIEVVNQSPMSVYQTLILQKKKMQFVPNKKDRRSVKNDEANDNKKSRFSALWEHPPIDLSIFSEGDKSLKADLTPNELQKRLFYINQQANTMFHEQGYNILYLAIGFLEWRDTFKPNDVHAAPLILIPVTLERKKVGKSFSIYWNEEDLQTNISLQAKLAEEDIEIPEFKITSYIEGVEHYLRDVRNAVNKKSNWKVTKHISLGFFSFTKFVMYNDLNPESWEDNVDLTKQELIEAIFDPKKNKHEVSFKEEDIDRELLYKDMYQVLDADSSQIAVIEDVKAGRNLVVEGPPGTGKSQTIVNIIAELLASEKSVLFVSEKMAALEVVKSRLDSVGLGKFVLELHSHKTKRKKLLKELQKGLNVRSMDDLDINQILRKLETLRKQLDDYADIIHRPLYDVKMSPYELYGMKESAEAHFASKKMNKNSDSSNILPLVRFKAPEDYTIKDLDDMIIDLENLAELYGTIANNNPWSKCNPKSLLPSDLREIEMLISDTLDSLNEFNLESERLHENFGIKTPHTLREYDKALESLKLLDDKNIQLIDSSVLTNKVWIDEPRKANELIEKLEEYQMTSRAIDKFNDHILTENLDNLINDLEKETNKRFKLFGGKNYKDELEYLYKNNVPNNKQALSDLQLVKEHIVFRKEIHKLDDIGLEYFGELWHLDASIVDLKEASNWIRKFNHLLKEGIYNKSTINLLSNSLFDIDSKSEINDYLNSADKFVKNLSKLESKLNPRSKLIFKKETKDVPLEKWEKQLNLWRGQISSLHLWSQYLNTKNVCLSTSAKLFVDIIEKRNIKKDDVKSLVLGNFADSLLNIIFAENQPLATFIGELHQNKISEFEELDSKIIQLNRRRIFQKLNKKTPKVFGAAENPEAKTLAGEFTRKRGHLPVRTLLEKSGGIIKQIKPCFMMSPLSIAQYLDPTNPKLQFDVVIFDEASQVKPEDALGAFMRAKSAVVMGDTQQLPPTSFFDQMTDIGDMEEVATALDMESILHLCKLSFPVKMLKWHYRSRHESLIAVSNKEFYDDELLVYPSPSHNTEELGLKFKHDNSTIYERGKSSANPLEARNVVKEIFKHFNKYGDTKSLGVGTFSVAQMNAILEELEIERKMHPELEHLFSDKMKERFFVKNLETIQGDERDVILISVGYGFDQNQRMSLNFGPLNQDGGERRLNVLITRAREKCIVFSNFKAHDMHLTANPPFGVKALKEFLEYAENISYGNNLRKTESEEPFEDAIYKFLKDNGYEVHKQVGCAGFRVDLAIVDENNPGKYIVGIQCDGKNYSSSKVARDRDRLRGQVLNGLGWNLYHLWSTDWYRNRDLTSEKLLKSIEKIKINSFIEEVKSMKIQKIPSKNDDLTIVNPIDDDFDESQDKVQDEEIDTKILNNTEDINELDINLSDSNIQDSSIINEIDESIEIDEKNGIENKYERKINSNQDFNNDNLDKETIIASIEKNEEDDDENNEEKIDEEIINRDIEEKNEEIIKKEIEEKIQKNIENDISYENSDRNTETSSDNDKLNNLTKKPKIRFRSHLNDDLILDSADNGRHRESNSNYDSIIEEKNNISTNNLVVESESKNQKDMVDTSDYELEKEINKVLGENDEDSVIGINDNYQNISQTKESAVFTEYEDIELKNSTNNNSNNKDVNNSNSYNNYINNNLDNSNNYVDNDYNNNDQTVNVENNGNYQDIDSFEENDNEIVEDLDGINVYEGISDFDNPLRRNTLNYIKNNSNNNNFQSQNIRDRMKSVSESINEIKNEVKYINKSLKEIENPTAPKNVVVIDRTKNISDDFELDEDIINSNVVSNNYADNDKENLDSNGNKFLNKNLSKDLNKELSNDLSNDLNEDLEDMIQDLNTDYIEIEKERNKESNKLKEIDSTKNLSKNVNIDDLIIPYETTKNIPLDNIDEFYKLTDSDYMDIIIKIVEFEGPIHIKDFIIRIKETCDLKRAGPKFKDKINQGISLAENNGQIILIEDFLFPLNWSSVPVRKRKSPNIDLISNEEIEENIKLILNFITPIESKELIKNVSRNFGFKSTSKKTATKINTVLDYMLANGSINNFNGKIEISS